VNRRRTLGNRRGGLVNGRRMLAGRHGGLVIHRRVLASACRTPGNRRQGLASDRPTPGNDVGKPGDPASGVRMDRGDERFENNRLASPPRIG